VRCTKRKKEKIPAHPLPLTPHASRIQVAAGLISRDGRYLIARRKAGVHLGGFWEFPGGKREQGESLEACLRRELREELGIEVTLPVFFRIISHAYPEKTVELHFFRCSIAAGDRWKPAFDGSCGRNSASRLRLRFSFESSAMPIRKKRSSCISSAVQLRPERSGHSAAMRSAGWRPANWPATSFRRRIVRWSSCYRKASLVTRHPTPSLPSPMKGEARWG